MILLSIDPSTKKSGFAVFKNSELVKFGTVVSDIATIAELMADDLFDERFFLAIEQQYSSFNTKSFMKLVEVRTVFETVATLNNALGIYTIPANSWQSYILGTNNRIKRKERKALSLERTHDIFGFEISNDNIADAILIGYYTIEMMPKLKKYFKQEVLK